MKKLVFILSVSALILACNSKKSETEINGNTDIKNSVEETNVDSLKLNKVSELLSEYDNVEKLRGKTFTNYNRDYEMLLKSSFYFSSTGSVHFIEKVEDFPAETRYNNFQYKLRGDTIEIYYDDNSKWKEEIRNTVFYEGKFYDSYMMIRNVHMKNNYEKYTIE